MSDIPAELTERFDVHEPLPESATGHRFSATEKTSGRRGVLELIRADAIGSTSDRQRLKRELAKQSTLSQSHLALPWVTGEIQKTLWLFREWVDGQTLRQRLDDAGTLSVSETLAITTQIAAALDELHRAGLLFRDLKPEHVMLRNDGSAVLVAAGLAARVDHDDVFDLYGTPSYLSPEQCKGKLVSFRSDLYALGCIIHEMVTGRPPFADVGNDPAQLIEAHKGHDAPEPPDALPEEARALLEKLLSKDPRQRPFSAQQVRRTLDPLLPDDLKSGEMPLPDGAQKKTLLGMPAVGSTPPKPPSLSKPPRPPSMNPKPAKPDPKVEAAKKKSADATQQVRLDDIIEEQPIAKSVPPPPPGASTPPAAPADTKSEAKKSAAKKSADTTQQLETVDIIEEQALAGASAKVSEPPPPPSAEAEVPAAAAALPPVEEFTAAAEAALMQKPAPGGAAVDALDYEDDAPTIARDAPSAIAGMAPSVPSDTVPGTQGAPHTTTDPGLGPAAAAAPQQHQVVQHQQTQPMSQPPVEQPQAHPSVPAPAVADNRNGLYMLGAAGLIFLSVLAFIGYQMASDTEEPVAAVTPPVAAPSAPTQTPEPAVEPSEPTPTEAVAEEPAEEVVEEIVEEPTEEVVEEPTEEVVEEPTEEVEEPAEEAMVASAMRTSMRSSMRASMRSSMRSSMSGFDSIREQARVHFQARRFREAAQAYQRATAINPRHAGSWAGLGAAKMSLRDYRGAAQAYQRAVTLNPRSSGFFTSLGHAYRLGGNRNGARQAYQRALALNPNNSSAQQWLQRL